MIGYRVFGAGGAVWRRNQGAVIPYNMPHAMPPFSNAQARNLVLRHWAFLVRWDENFDAVPESEWWHLIKDDWEDLDGLSGNTRSKVRRGLKRFVSGRVSRDEVLNEGYDVYRSAFGRYNTFETVYSPERFHNAVLSLPSEIEFWAVRDRETGAMVSFSENVVRDGACFYNTIWFQPEALKQYAGYALIYEMNKHYLNECGLAYVSDGARNISHQTGIHEFLQEKFLFRRAYADLRVVYFPGIGLIVRLLFPFRRWFNSRSARLFKKVAVILDQERIRRVCVESDT